MGLWEMVVLIVLISTSGDVFHRHYKTKERQSTMNNQFSGLGDQLNRIEERLGNLETLVVEEEKHKDFDRAL